MIQLELSKQSYINELVLYKSFEMPEIDYEHNPI